MAHFAEINKNNNEVLRVIVVGEDQIKKNGGSNTPELESWVKSFHPEDINIKENLGGVYPETYWKQTSYNTYHNEHKLGGTPFRKNYASPGYTYDAQRDAFIPPKPPYESWTLNENTCDWDPPVPFPSIFNYEPTKSYDIVWDEDNLRWIGYTKEETPQKFYWEPNLKNWIIGN